MFYETVSIDRMSNYFVLVWKGPTTKWVSVNLVITDFLCVINLSIKCIVYINDAVAYFYFSNTCPM